jgi:hypothetical protein
MPQDFATLNKALIINDEANDGSGQIAPGEEALDGDGYAVITVVRSTLAPTAADIRPKGQLWHRTTNDALYWSRGAGLWFQFRDASAVPAHQATHHAGGSDALPWTTIHGSGTLAARPAAAAANNGYYYDTTDTQQLFRSTGAAWVEIGISALAKEYTHSQGSAATGWVVNHNLGRRPKAVAVLDSAGTAILAPYQHISVNQLVVTFGRPSTGTCIVG